MQLIPIVINTTFKPYDLNGDSAHITITAHWSDSTTDNYTTTNGQIQIQKTLYDSSAVTTLELDSVTFSNNQNYLAWIILRKIHQPLNDSNLAQSPKDWSDQFPQPVNVDMSNPNINGQTIYCYVLPKLVQNPLAPAGTMMRVDAQVIQEMMCRDANETHHYLTVNVDSLKPFYKLQFTYNETNNQQMTQAQVDTMKAMSELTDTMAYIPNTGDTVFVPVIYHLVTANTDSILQLCQARNDQYTASYYKNESPGDDVFYKTTYTYDGYRASVGTSQNNPNDLIGIIYDEYYKMRTVTGDPINTSSGPYIWSNSPRGATPLAYIMARAVALFNLGTKFATGGKSK
jgi:hypothetical protein